MKQATLAGTMLVLGLLQGVEVDAIYLGPQGTNGSKANTSTTINTSNSIKISSMSATSAKQCIGSPSAGAQSLVAGNVTYPTSLVQYSKSRMDKNPIPLNNTDLYDSLLTSRYFNERPGLQFDFIFAKNQYFRPEMYGGQFNNSLPYLIYPAQVWVGSQGGLLFVFVQTLYLYGSPYGNISERGSNQLTLYTRIGSWSYGFPLDINMLPGQPLNKSWAITNGKPLQTPEGWYVYGYISNTGGNQTYYVGNYNSQYYLGNFSYNSQETYDNKGFYFGGSIILGSYTAPVMTRYLYIINTTRLPEPQQPGCLQMKAMFSLETLRDCPNFNGPCGLPITSTGFTDYSVLIDNYPTHDLYGPLTPTDYSNIIVREPMST
jgi:hypothetical protein